jgi:hypothetical protein
MSKSYFSPKEFDSPDAPGTGMNMDPELVAILNDMREECGFPFIINSGVRTPRHNRDVGGTEASDHLMKYDGFAHAVDIRCTTSQQRFAIVRAALTRGITRIGIGKTFVHIGNWGDNPQDVIWMY